MSCSRDLVEAYLDQELDANERSALERHLAICPDCAETYARLRGQKDNIKAVAPYFSAPANLRQSVRVALGRLAVEPQPPADREGRWRLVAIAASVLLVLSLSWNLLRLRERHVESNLAESVLAEHIRSLLGTRLVDVASSDQHTVKPWFAGKLDFSPDVRDLQSQGFPLEGGRVDYLADRRVAALVYHRRLHVITLFIWPTGSISTTGIRISENGYNLLEWTNGPMTYWAVSDVSLGDLETFRTLLK